MPLQDPGKPARPMGTPLPPPVSQYYPEKHRTYTPLIMRCKQLDLSSTCKEAVRIMTAEYLKKVSEQSVVVDSENLEHFHIQQDIFTNDYETVVVTWLTEFE